MTQTKDKIMRVLKPKYLAWSVYKAKVDWINSFKFKQSCIKSFGVA